MGGGISDGQSKGLAVKPIKPEPRLPSISQGQALMLWNRAILSGQHTSLVSAPIQAFGVRQALRGHEAMAYLNRNMS